MDDSKNLTCSERIKRILSTSDYNLTTLNDELNRLNGTDTSVQNLSARLKRESLKYTEVEQILDILGYSIDWNKKSFTTNHFYTANTKEDSELHLKKPTPTSKDEMVKYINDLVASTVEKETSKHVEEIFMKYDISKMENIFQKYITQINKSKENDILQKYIVQFDKDKEDN